MTQTDITVQGMTCGHCVNAVTEELKTIDGVRDVSVELNAGGDSPVRITSDGDLDPQAIAAAVDEAGYQMAG
ncbi:heavy-metal-associated domain-containing protein [Flexivirga sp. ID2601S]|uniref:Heavy-metal-associated domain-containing protein n=1 Tax=Flexivirga aerilata TaxID=1656889 RepID=A0A849ABB5_9MICO|nr:heavy-metal-associated domain-containing protein [Flexivirga aerilata]NNG38204.1 heavy-metal-associated domain-containing protein [Flexivirga aerilata]